jgi:DNA polymerase II small subunit/DNA polymerase delta subunit B
MNLYLISLLGTSGQNLDDIDLQSTIDSRVQILENCLNWGVIAPTCPDTLSMKNYLFYIKTYFHIF